MADRPPFCCRDQTSGGSTTFCCDSTTHNPNDCGGVIVLANPTGPDLRCAQAFGFKNAGLVGERRRLFGGRAETGERSAPPVRSAVTRCRRLSLCKCRIL